MRKNAHRKDRDKTVLGIISNKRNNFQSIHIGQTNFEQDDVRRMFLNFVNRACSRMGNLCLKTCEFKLLAQAAVSLCWLSTMRMVFSVPVLTHENHSNYIALGWRM